MRVPIYVPNSTRLQGLVAAGSAIVGEERAAGVVIYYEGNLYGASNLNKYEEKLSAAAGRLKADYPTAAKLLVQSEDLVEVGVYDTAIWAVAAITNREALAEWLGGTSDPVFAR